MGLVHFIMEVKHFGRPALPPLTLVACELHTPGERLPNTPVGTGAWRSKGPLQPDRRKGYDRYPVPLENIEQKLCVYHADADRVSDHLRAYGLATGDVDEYVWCTYHTMTLHY